MPDMVIVVTGLSSNVAPAGKFIVTCLVRTNGADQNSFEATLNYTDNASQKTAAIEAEAIALLAGINIMVGGGDKRTMFGGPSN
jgi:hypothetical protein